MLQGVVFAFLLISPHRYSMAIDPFWGNLFRRDSKEKDELFNILKEVPIFQDLNRRELNKIEGILHRRSYAADESIVKEGELGVGMYIVVNGQVDIIQSGEDGNIMRLATFGAGDFFGEQALLNESPRTASALASVACQAVGFFRPDLLDLIESDPRLGLKIVMRLSQMISVRLRQTNRMLKEARDTAKAVEQERLEAKGKEMGSTEPAAGDPSSGLTQQNVT